jgi:hypothetical protein
MNNILTDVPFNSGLVLFQECVDPVMERKKLETFLEINERAIFDVSCLQHCLLSIVPIRCGELRRMVKKFGWQVAGDGHCQFRAVAHQLSLSGEVCTFVTLDVGKCSLPSSLPVSI